MKILMVSSYLPYPLFSGGHIRLFNILKNLSQRHEITLVCEKRANQTKKDIEEVEKICKKVIAIDRKKQWSLANIVKTGLSNSPFLITGHAQTKMREEINKLLTSEKFDLVHVETSYVMQNLPKTPIPVVLAEHNVEYLVYKRYSNRISFLLRPLLNIDVFKLKNKEEAFWEKADYLIAVSEDEAKIMKAKNKNVVIVPNGVDINRFKIKDLRFTNKNNNKTILFIGDFRWVENRDALRWIYKDIWPLLKLKTKDLEFKINLRIVGKDIPEYLKKTRDDDIIFDENADNDTSKIFQKANLLLAPIRIGGGTSFKILEAMASGVVVATTRLGASGIGAKDHEEVLISDEADELTNRIIEVFENDLLYKEITANARKLIEKKYDWRIIVEKLEDVYRLATSN
ncbi:MAG: glycosyltransferase family 4 protein [Patescibacteria group bacterium]|nr:glycosyltransferase family 4 protein [Patescibacteria group bacterium]MCL6096508.1 glycosyltransferase family 4 protein [Patescibacteria group bacterium]